MREAGGSFRPLWGMIESRHPFYVDKRLRNWYNTHTIEG
jgi:hypothetical protein